MLQFFFFLYFLQLTLNISVCIRHKFIYMNLKIHNRTSFSISFKYPFYWTNKYDRFLGGMCKPGPKYFVREKIFLSKIKKLAWIANCTYHNLVSRTHHLDWSNLQVQQIEGYKLINNVASSNVDVTQTRKICNSLDLKLHTIFCFTYIKINFVRH